MIMRMVSITGELGYAIQIKGHFSLPRGIDIF